MSRIGFIGLGQMGAAMASNLLAEGHELRVSDVSVSAVEQLVAQGATPASSQGDVASSAEFIVTMLPNGAIVRDVLLGPDGVAERMSPDALMIDMSTVHPFETDALIGEMAALGLAMMDAPVGRTSDHAARGELLILAGGSNEQIDRAQHLFDCMGSETVRAGGPGRGIRLKIVNNFMSIALNALSAEAATLAEAIGLDLGVAIDVMNGTPAGKGHFTTTWPNKVLAGDLTPAFTIDLAHKDLGIALDLANQVGVPLHCGAATRETYSSARSAGRGGQDWSAVLDQVRAAAGRDPANKN